MRRGVLKEGEGTSHTTTASASDDEEESRTRRRLHTQASASSDTDVQRRCVIAACLDTALLSIIRNSDRSSMLQLQLQPTDRESSDLADDETKDDGNAFPLEDGERQLVSMPSSDNFQFAGEDDIAVLDILQRLQHSNDGKTSDSLHHILTSLQANNQDTYRVTVVKMVVTDTRLQMSCNLHNARFRASRREGGP
jgi:hypothetical protein